jgi:acetoin utilization protein AcuB
MEYWKKMRAPGGCGSWPLYIHPLAICDLRLTVFGRFWPVDKPFQDWYILFQRPENPFWGERPMRVKKLMARKLVTIPPNTSILKAMEVMRKNSIRHLPVVDGEKLMGFLTEGDLRQGSLLSMVDKVSIEDVMIKNPVCISPEAGIEEAAKLVFKHKIGGLPVLKGNKLVGILTIVDILKAFIEMMGLLKTSSRFDVILGNNPHAFADVSRVFKEHHAEIISVGMSRHKDRKKRIYYFRCEKCPVNPIRKSLEEKGYRVVSVTE